MITEFAKNAAKKVGLGLGLLFVGGVAATAIGIMETAYLESQTPTRQCTGMSHSEYFNNNTSGYVYRHDMVTGHRCHIPPSLRTHVTNSITP